MPSASSYTNKLRFSASVKNTKAQLPGGVGNLTQGSIAGCGLDVNYSPIQYLQVCGCNKDRPIIPPPPPPPPPPSITVDLGSTDFNGDGITVEINGVTFPLTTTLIMNVTNGINNNYITSILFASLNASITSVTSNGIIDANWNINNEGSGYFRVRDNRIPPILSNPLVSTISPTILVFTFSNPINTIPSFQISSPFTEG